MSSIYSRRFWALAGERAARSAAHGFLLALGLSSTGPANLFLFDFEVGIGSALGGAVLSVLTSIIAGPVGPGDDPSLL